MKSQDNSIDIMWKIFLSLVIIALIIGAFRMGQANVRNNNNVIPKIVGVYQPLLISLTEPTNIVIVLDANNKYHVQLTAEIKNAMQQIEQLNNKTGGK